MKKLKHILILSLIGIFVISTFDSCGMFNHSGKRKYKTNCGCPHNDNPRIRGNKR